jgi:hypothetical protein
MHARFVLLSLTIGLSLISCINPEAPPSSPGGQGGTGGAGGGVAPERGSGGSGGTSGGSSGGGSGGAGGSGTAGSGGTGGGKADASAGTGGSSSSKDAAPISMTDGAAAETAPPVSSGNVDWTTCGPLSFKPNVSAADFCAQYLKACSFDPAGGGAGASRYKSLADCMMKYAALSDGPMGGKACVAYHLCLASFPDMTTYCHNAPAASAMSGPCKTSYL